LRFRANATGDPQEVFAALCRGDRLPHAAYLDLGRHVFASGSPELFFELEGDRIRSRPMKGTWPRGRHPAEDVRHAAALSESPKNRAENLMITDMVRNDLGRIARTGSVQVDDLFAIERYATVHQMTSTVTARTDAPLLELFRALFPAASITGAPKRRAMQIIAETEASPRGIYTGCIGTIGPGRRARFSVAIRTAWLDQASGIWEYGTGSGIVWDSDPDQEYAECLSKMAALRPRPEFSLFETILHVPGEPGLAERHFARMMSSARHFGFEADGTALAHLWERETRDRPQGAARVQLDRDGKVEIRWSERRFWPEPVRIGLAKTPVDSRDPLLFHKTTRRHIYERAAAECPGCDEVLLVNEGGFLTEGTRSNLALRIKGRLLTPPLDHGLLPGILRQKLLEEGVLTEAPVRLEDLQCAEEVWVFNALRGVGRAAWTG
jgi:para-aminobenzoate synthetase/4-amino-4-deoxychorismate lyase